MLLPVDDLLAGGPRHIVKEWRVPDQHLKEDGPQGPPVHDLGVAILAEDFGGDVVRSSHQRTDPLSTLLEPHLFLPMRDIVHNRSLTFQFTLLLEREILRLDFVVFAESKVG